MAIELDDHIWQHALLGSAQGCGQMRLDWHGLRCRLLAARETVQALAAGCAYGEAAVIASFSGQAARMIGAFAQESAFVNPNDSANRNADGANMAFVADGFSSGDRG